MTLLEETPGFYQNKKNFKKEGDSMFRLRSVINIIMILFLAGCSSITTATIGNPLPVITQPSASLPVVTNSRTGTPTISLTPTKQTSTFSPTPTIIITPSSTIAQTISPKTNLDIKCIDIDPNLSIDEKLKGVLVLAPSPVDYMNPAYLYNLATGEKYLIPHQENETTRFFSISPNGNWLAYEKDSLDQMEHVVSSKLVIADATGTERATITLQENEWHYGWRGDWINDDWLIIRQGDQPAMDAQRLVNPFTGEQQVIQPWGTYPGIYPLTDRESLWNIATAYDPNLKLVVYPGTTKEGKSTLTLWDRQDNIELATFPFFRFFPVEMPKWSPDGKQFVFATTIKNHVPPQNIYDELFNVTRDGQITQLTHLTEEYQEVSIGHYSWSPDGHKIAFWLWRMSPDGIQNDSLTILNMETRQVTNYCIEGKYYNNPALPPSWSPDGKQLIIENRSKDDTIGRVVLVDIDRGSAAVVVTADKLDPIGWMVSP